MVGFNGKFCCISTTLSNLYHWFAVVTVPDCSKSPELRTARTSDTLVKEEMKAGRTVMHGGTMKITAMHGMTLKKMKMKLVPEEIVSPASYVNHFFLHEAN